MTWPPGKLIKNRFVRLVPDQRLPLSSKDFPRFRYTADQGPMVLRRGSLRERIALLGTSPVLCYKPHASPQFPILCILIRCPRDLKATTDQLRPEDLRHWRKEEARMSQPEFAKLSGLSVPTIAR